MRALALKAGWREARRAHRVDAVLCDARRVITRGVRLLSGMLLAAVLAGCAGVKVTAVDAKDYIAQRRGDVLTTGALGASARETLAILGLDESQCRTDARVCLRSLAQTDGLDDERRLSTLAELWLQRALGLEANRDGSHAGHEVLDAYLEVARYAYAYLFFSGRTPGERAFEDRQTQVRDYYNYAVQQATTRVFAQYREQPAAGGKAVITTPAWQITGHMQHVRLPNGRALPQELIPAATLTFHGLRSLYRRDGFGAELVAVTARSVAAVGGHESTVFSETPFPAVTGILSFPGTTLAQVLATTQADLTGYDPYREDTISLAGTEVPLAANFTSGYGLWLARSGFARQALQSVLGQAEGFDQPHVYLLQPFDPERRIVVMLHGLASSPEAWINVANEILGDEALRQRYQIWQVYYPTNAPLALNRTAIASVLSQTLAQLNPAGDAPAAQDMVLLGHSMGGVLSRLLVSASGDVLWDDFLAERPMSGRALEEARADFAPYLRFAPLEGVSRAVFIAAPHRGTPVAEGRVARWLSTLIRLPAMALDKLANLERLLASAAPPGTGQPMRIPTSLDNLSDQDRFVQLAATLSIAPQVRYHTIVGNHTPDVTLAASSDGVVPYTSAHWPGAASEVVIPFSHSVQETPQAILEIRRILREHAQLTPVRSPLVVADRP